MYLFADVIHKRSKSAGQSLELPLIDDTAVTIATPQCIGEHMTKEDQYYIPYSADTNPFDTMDNLRGGKKIISGSTEDLLSDAACGNLPSIVKQYNTVGAQPSSKVFLSLPGNLDLTRQALEQFSHEITKSKLTKDIDACSSSDSAVDLSMQDSISHNKQLNKECAMLFTGLDLISMNRLKSRSNDNEALENQFQDDLEDVLRSCSSSDSWVSEDHRSHMCDRVEEEKMSKHHLNKTLLDKRRQLRHVEGKAKMEQLQIQLDRLKKDNHKK